jgi:hypothetical protein
MKLDPVTKYLIEDSEQDLIKSYKDHIKHLDDNIEKLYRSLSKMTPEEAEKTLDKIHDYEDKRNEYEYEFQKLYGEYAEDEIENATMSKILAVGWIITAAVILGNKLYKQYLSQAARICKNAPNKEKCMEEFKKKAIQAEIAQLEKAKTYCTKSKNPQECINKLNQEIQKNKEKLKK